jgi:DNA-binding MarR family transcriptional regulator
VSDDLGRRLEAALGEMLLRRNRSHLYAGLAADIGPEIDATTYPVLSGLARLGPASSARLAAEVGLDRSGASRHASRLVEAGYVRRRRDPNDARATLLVLTARGERAVQKLRARLARTLTDALASWAPKEATSFVSGLERFVAEQRQLDHSA